MEVFGEFRTWATAIMDEINEQIIAIMEEAEKDVSELWKFKEDTEKKRGFPNSDKSKLRVRVHNKNGYYTIEWFFQKYYKSKLGEWKAQSEFIKRPKNKYKYTDTSLRREAEDWEILEVLKLENHLSHYREIYSDLMAVKSDLRRIRNKSEKLEDHYDRFNT